MSDIKINTIPDQSDINPDEITPVVEISPPILGELYIDQKTGNLMYLGKSGIARIVALA